jgi:hypothetical protein
MPWALSVTQNAEMATEGLDLYVGSNANLAIQILEFLAVTDGGAIQKIRMAEEEGVGSHADPTKTVMQACATTNASKDIQAKAQSVGNHVDLKRLTLECLARRRAQPEEWGSQSIHVLRGSQKWQACAIQIAHQIQKTLVYCAERGRQTKSHDLIINPFHP